jgi:hypothetical protein
VGDSRSGPFPLHMEAEETELVEASEIQDGQKVQIYKMWISGQPLQLDPPIDAIWPFVLMVTAPKKRKELPDVAWFEI